MTMPSNKVIPLHTNPPPDKSATFQEAWTYLEAGIEYIMTHPQGFTDNQNPSNSESTSSSSSKANFDLHTGMYSTVHNFSTNSSDLYAGVGDYLVRHVERVYQTHFTESGEGLDLIQTYASEWDKYNAGVKNVNKIFTYLNRHWVKRERTTMKTVYPVNILALAKWRDHIFLKLQPKLTPAMINLVIKHPTNESPEGVLAKTLLDSFVSLGFNDEDPEKESLIFHKKYFKQPFLDTLGLDLGPGATSTSTTSTTTDDAVPVYLAWAKSRFDSEGGLGQVYVHSSTEQTLKRVLGGT